MPKLSKRAKIPGQIDYEYILNYADGKTMLSQLKKLEAYVKSQDGCPGSNIKNEIFGKYHSENGGGAFLSGRFDDRILKWIEETLKSKAKIEPNAYLKLAAIRSEKNTHWYVLRFLALKDTGPDYYALITGVFRG